MDFKENFKVSYKGDQLGYDYYNMRQMSCLGVVLISHNGESLVYDYVSYFSENLNNDSKFAGDILQQFRSEISPRFKKITIFTDCGPHFRSQEFLYRVAELKTDEMNYVSLNNFAEYHGKSVVDSHFGRLIKDFPKIDESGIKDVMI